MKKIDLYISKRFLVTFFVALLLIIGIVIIFDISEKIDDFSGKHVPLHEIIFDYYINFVPYFINMFSSLFVFITVIFFTSRMAANSEIIAILSGGVSYHRMMVPYIATSVLIALLSLGLNLYVIPQANAKRVEFEVKYIRHSHVKNKRREIHYQIAPGQYVYVDNFSAWNNTAYRFTLEDIDGGRLKRKLTADSAVWDSTFGGWHLRNWFIREYSEGLEDRVTSGEKKDTVIALTVTDFYENNRTVEKLSGRQLNQLIDKQKMRGDANVMYAEIEKHTRTSMPFSCIILTIMGVSLSSRKRRGGTGWNLAIGIGLAFSYILFQRFSQMFVFTGALPAWLALWIPNVLYTIIAAVLYDRARR